MMEQIGRAVDRSIWLDVRAKVPGPATMTQPSTCLVALLFLLVPVILFVLWWKRRQTYYRLVHGGLPTVFWRPKFSQFDASRVTASTITNILPRMHRLGGPYGMYGTVYGVNTAVIHIAHPEPARKILCGSDLQGGSPLKSFNGATKTPAYNHFKNFCGEGVFTADGEDWRSKRTAVLHALMRGKVPFQERIEKEAHRTAEQLICNFDRCTNNNNNNNTNGTVNVVPILQHATIGLIYQFITHNDLSTLVSETTYRKDSTEKTQRKNTLLAAYLESITQIRLIILAQSRSIWFLLPRWIYTTFSTLYQKEEQTMGPIRLVATKACTNAAPNSPLDLLKRQTLYEAIDKASLSKSLVDEAITLLFAGQDTSAATLSWTLHLLALHPHVQAKLAEEVRVVMKDVENAVVSKQIISRMPYLDGVIKESMRLYPVAPFIVRKLERGIELHSESTSAAHSRSTQNEKHTNTRLPKESFACIWIYSIHRHPSYWSSPDSFLPDRWLVQDAHKRDKGVSCTCAYMPYASGSRNCVGQPLANFVLRSLLARMIQRYIFVDYRVDTLLKEGIKDTASLRKDMQSGFTVLPKGGLDLCVKLRSELCHEEGRSCESCSA